MVHGDGRQTRDFVYIDDVVDALVRAAHEGSGLVVNVGTGVGTSVRDLWDLMAGPSGRPPAPSPRRADDVQRFALALDAGPHPARAGRRGPTSPPACAACRADVAADARVRR